MSNVWDADIDIGETKAALLIEKQFPELAPVRCKLLGVGWDNVAYLVNDALVFRFPRRIVATALLEAEIRALPYLAPHLPLPVPEPTFIGAPSEQYPYVWSGYKYLPGETASQPNWSDPERTRNVSQLAQFLSALHQIPVTDDAPPDTLDRADCLRALPRTLERLQKNADRLTDFDLEHLARLTQETAQAPAFAGPKRWVHGDLYPRHLLVDDWRHLCGVIDWGDVHVGDTALDLSIAFTFLPPVARVVFRIEYGDIDDATWQRARYRALHYGAVLVDYATSTWDVALLRTGLAALSFASLDD